MFNKKVIDVLGEINNITNSIIIKYPTTVAVSESQDMMISLDIKALDADEFEDIGLLDNLSEFLSLFKLFGEDKTVNYDGNTINIGNETINSSYIVDSIALMETYDKSPEQFEKTEMVPSVAEFDLNPEDIKNIKQASGVFKDLSEVLFTSKDDVVNISLAATNKFNAKSNKFNITKNSSACKTSKEFEIKIPVENFKMIPMSAYAVEVKYNAARDSYRILMSSKTLENFKILLTVKI